MERQVLERHSTSTSYLEVVMCYLPAKAEYVTWIFNRSLDCYAYGNYFTDSIDAVRDYWKRVKEYNGGEI